jgi:TonB family protein
MLLSINKTKIILLILFAFVNINAQTNQKENKKKSSDTTKPFQLPPSVQKPDLQMTSIVASYPKAAFDEKIYEGKVILEGRISKEGTIDDIKIYQTSNKIFNDAAVDYVKRLRFDPKTIEITLLRFKVSFKLK